MIPCCRVSDATGSPFRSGEAVESVGVGSGQSLEAAAISTRSALQMMRLTKRQIEVTMFGAGAKEIGELNALRGKLMVEM